ncbi:hypothetical protein BASA61_001482 [Batrachochytrium salamandrivorans]|nr:hypothetical protein BASA62_002657 [Batrachochytrium salamandrivorans]KAH6578267.1 hypothetical protein BASA60_003656 [Batrachochytrium salamandrivorans]KAH6602069.1 hypothetical protein BASA61_001482 [Batrachochytrium salamandrivorans]
MLRLIVVSIVFPGGMAAEMALYEEDLPDLTRPGVDPLPYQQPLVLAIVMVFKSPAAVDRRTAASIRMGSNGTHSQEYHIPDAKYIRKDLLSWYSVNKRLLPWRHEWEPAKAKNTDWLAQRAYAVWVSEIMLQQTQVTTVVDYFRRWMIKWPDVFALANATLEDVNRVWSGLGYYSRAKRLHQGAQIVVSKFGGQLPTTAAALEKHIPGIGPYTAGAIASIAFNEHAPLVDGNVIRVLSRLCAIGSNPKTKASVTMHWKTAGHLLDPDMPGDFNQAMMDLGATVCTPKTPQCTVCPLKTHCLAFAEQEEYHALQYNMGHRKSLEKGISTAISPKIDTFGVECVKRVRNSTKSTADSSVGLQGVCSICPAVSIDDIEEWPVTRYPLKVKRKPSRLQQCAVAVIELYDGTDDRRVLVAKSPETGLLAGLWDFPIMIVSDVDPALNGLSKDSEKGLKGGLLSKAIDKLIYQYVGSVETILREDLGSVVHIFSHIRRTMFVQYIRIRYQDASVVPFALSPSTGRSIGTRQSKRKKPAGSSSLILCDTVCMLPPSNQEICWLSLEELDSGKVAVPATLKKVLSVFKSKCLSNPTQAVIPLDKKTATATTVIKPYTLLPNRKRRATSNSNKE